MARAKGFGNSLRAYGNKVEAGVAKSIGDYTSMQFRELMDDNVTPVLTGFLRSRWNVTVGKSQIPALEAPPIRDPSQVYPQPSQPPIVLTKIQSTVTSNNATYSGVVNDRRMIITTLEGRMRGRMDSLLKKNAPK